jgi:hypothetical protein
MSCQITIRFHPQLNEDIDDVFPLLAETGAINIPLICRSKKAVVRCERPIIDFGQVIFGEDATRSLVLKNEGALPTEVVIKSVRGADIATRTEALSERGSVQNGV